MNYDNKFILRGHGYLEKNTGFTVLPNYGFITFSKNGESRKSKLNDLMVTLITNLLKKIYNFILLGLNFVLANAFWIFHEHLPHPLLLLGMRVR